MTITVYRTNCDPPKLRLALAACRAGDALVVTEVRPEFRPASRRGARDKESEPPCSPAE